MTLVEEEHPKVGMKVMRKHASKKSELIDSALGTLARLGYSRTNLRTIASDAGVSLGTIHYYFKDKDELLKLCVIRFKDNFIKATKNVFDMFDGTAELWPMLSKLLINTIEQNGSTHRMWYDFRTQAM
jgi:AcrR family transcriptional regulator